MRGSVMDARRVAPALLPLFTRFLAQYEQLRILQLRLRLLVDTPSNLYPADAAQQALLARAAMCDSAAAYLNELRQGMRQTRSDFEAVLAQITTDLA